MISSAVTFVSSVLVLILGKWIPLMAISSKFTACAVALATQSQKESSNLSSKTTNWKTFSRKLAILSVRWWSFTAAIKLVTASTRNPPAMKWNKADYGWASEDLLNTTVRVIQSRDGFRHGLNTFKMLGFYCMAKSCTSVGNKVLPSMVQIEPNYWHSQLL